MINYLASKLEISHNHHKPLRSMEGLRGIAVLLVFLVHYSSLINPWLTSETITIAEFVHSFGNLGVDLFFILSGYLIYGSIITKEFDTWPYAKRRIERIYPTFLVVLAVYVILSILLPEQSKFPEAAADKAIYLLQNILLLPGMFDINPIITVSWSLSYEVFYYLLIPIVILALTMKSWSSNTRILFWSVITIAGFTACYLFGGHVRLLMFICGIILFEVKRIKNIEYSQFGTICLISALSLYGLHSMIEFNHILSLALVYLLFFTFCLTALSEDSFSAKWLVYTPLRWLGNMSYSYYLIHGLALQFSFLVLGYVIPQGYTSSSIYFWLWAPLLIITLGVSFLLFLTVERPMSLAAKSNKATRIATT